MDASPPEFDRSAQEPEEMVAILKDLYARFKSGEISCAAIRLFKKDGTWEDVILATTPEGRDELRRQLELRKAKLH